jgi:hypothetical protein
MRHQYFEMNTINSGSPLFLIIIASILIIVLTYLTIYKRKDVIGSDSTDKQKETTYNFPSLVLAMLTQHGDKLTQIEISSNLDLPADVTAEKLMEMEKEGLITRKWENDKYTFLVKKTDKYIPLLLKGEIR